MKKYIPLLLLIAVLFQPAISHAESKDVQAQNTEEQAQKMVEVLQKQEELDKDIMDQLLNEQVKRSGVDEEIIKPVDKEKATNYVVRKAATTSSWVQETAIGLIPYAGPVAALFFIGVAVIGIFYKKIWLSTIAATFCVMLSIALTFNGTNIVTGIFKFILE